MKSLFVFNPGLKEKNRKKILWAASQCFEEGSYDVCLGTIHDYSAADLAFYDHFIAVGGDGTVFATVNAMMKTAARKLTLIPAGSGNDFARTLGLSDDALAILKIARDGLPRPMDLARWNNWYFLNIASVGFDADVNANNSGRLKALGRISYSLHVMKTFFTYRPRRIKKEGLHQTAWTLFTIGNGGYYGGGFPIFPKASPFSGELLFFGAGKSRLKYIVPFLLCLFLGKDEWWKKDMVREKTKTMDFILLQEANVNLDGENFRQKGPVHVEVLPEEILYCGPVYRSFAE
ncbi:MAG: diacylglycerol kinase family protein [Peptoniphilus sp.]|nr:diacylglycerol kinase family protein [Peptoniphilus sp.]MDY3118317.1 diacylglycerol kinase family protein [Peptoniphilus sp.]